MSKSYLAVCSLLVVWLLSTSSSCDRTSTIIESTTTVELNFALRYQGRPLVVGSNQAFPFPANGNIQFTNINTFISNVVLLGENGSDETALLDIFHLDFNTLTDSIGAERGISIPIRRVPVGKYLGLAFNVGVESELNSSKPSSYFGTHPLANQDAYRTDWESYVFSDIEGKADTDLDGDYSNVLFRYRSGTDDQLVPVTFFADKVLTDQATTRFVVQIDVDKWLNANQAINMQVNNGTNSLTELSEGSKIAANTTAAFSLKN